MTHTHGHQLSTSPHQSNPKRMSILLFWDSCTLAHMTYQSWFLCFGSLGCDHHSKKQYNKMFGKHLSTWNHAFSLTITVNILNIFSQNISMTMNRRSQNGWEVSKQFGLSLYSFLLLLLSLIQSSKLIPIIVGGEGKYFDRNISIC